jgi:DNA-binding HxlR family transcriptional regulator
VPQGLRHLAARVEYNATGMARELHDSLTALTEWAERHRAGIAEARSFYDGRRDDPAA